MSLDFQPGPIEASQRFRASEARLRLFGRVTPKRIEVVRHILLPEPEPEPEPVEQTEPEMSDLPYATPTVRSVILSVCAKHGVSKEQLLSKSRVTRIVRCRQECCHTLRHSGIVINGEPISLLIIARHLGKLDHTTVLHSIRVHEARLAAGENLTGTEEVVAAALFQQTTRPKR
jgi:hypothetical protein